MDRDRNGIIEETEFRSLLSEMRVEHGETELLVQMLDPYNNQKMTYSEVVHLLSSHMVRQDDHSEQMTSVLEKYVNVRTGGGYLERTLSSQSRRNTGGGQEDIRQMIVHMNDDQNYPTEQDGDPYGEEGDSYT